MKKIVLKIGGMSCSGCSNGLEKYLNRQKGIISASVNLVMASASIQYEDEITISEIEEYIKDAGFESLGEEIIEIKKKKNTNFYFLIYGFLALLLMYISMAHMVSLPIIPYLDIYQYPVYFSASLLIITIPFLYYGFDIIKNGFKNLIHKMPNMDTLVSIGVISSFLYSTFGVIMVFLGYKEYIHSLYFESTAFVIYFIKLGRYIDKNSKEKTKEAIKELVLVTPTLAKLKTETSFKEITIDEVKKGDILVCLAGDKIAVDGVITKGETHLDESFITGESVPSKKGINDKVIAGSINYEGYIEYKALKIGKDSTISEIVKLVIEATNTKAPISFLADKISSYFVPIIMIISIITFIINLILGVSISDSLNRFVTVLVIACPCALGLATPLALVVGEGLCAKDGILVKNSALLESASHVDTLIFDKTGTLTNGELSVAVINNYSKLKERELLTIIGSIEAKSTHPIAKGIIKYIEAQKIKLDDNYRVEVLPGYGLKGIKDTNIYYIGNSSLVKNLKITNPYHHEEEKLHEENTVFYVICNMKIIGMIGVKDKIRENTKEVITTLKKWGIDIYMLTGDNKKIAEEVGKKINIEHIIAEVLPKDKAKIIEKLKSEGKKVIMVGDGINDAPSLALADIGISISGGTDIATDSADVILINNNLFKIIDFIKISRNTLKNIKQNLFWAFLYNIIMIPLATGLFNQVGVSINPMLACTFMIISSLTVIFNTLRLKKIKL